MLTLLCPKHTRQKTLSCGVFRLFHVAVALLARKGKGNAYKKCMHFFIALMLHKGSARSFTLSEV